MTGDQGRNTESSDRGKPDETVSRARRFLTRWGKVATGPRPGWRGASALLALVTAGVVGWSVADQALPGTGFVLATQTATNVLIAVAGSAVLTGLLFVTAGRFRALPWWYVWTLGTCLILLLTLGAGASMIGWFTAVAVLVVGSSLLGGALGSLLPHAGRTQMAPRDRRFVLLALALVVLVGPGVWLCTASQGALELADEGSPARVVADDPAAPGPFTVTTLTYGSGQDERAAYGRGVDLRTEPVDATGIIQGWDSRRQSLWGFGAENLPLNARVWHPQGEGPFPLVLMVHGNNSTVASSEPGFEYLGELLASHGMIAASVDQNFLNTGVLDRSGGIRGADVARGWLLLEHLRTWDSWNRGAEGPFTGRVDMSNIGLIGHSRGGEAVAVAKYLEGLDTLPGDESIRLDHDFEIRSLLALAPSDGQYRPGGEPVRLVDVNYLTLQGSHDADVTGFGGLNQYERISFSGDEQYLKAAVYVERANHGQFNSLWGDRDVGNGLPKLFIDADALIPAEDQRRIAQVYATSFLRTTLMDDPEHAELLRDHRSAGEWLPRGNYVNLYSDNGTVTVDDSALRATGFRTADNVHLPLRNEPGNDVVRALEWDRGGKPPTLTGALPPVPAPGQHVVFDAVASSDSDDLADSVRVQLTDGSGRSATLPLARTMPLKHLVPAQYLKSAWLHSDKLTQPMLQTYRVPLQAFATATPGLDLADLRTVSLVFDNDIAGSVLVDDLGLSGERAR